MIVIGGPKRTTGSFCLFAGFQCNAFGSERRKAKWTWGGHLWSATDSVPHAKDKWPLVLSRIEWLNGSLLRPNFVPIATSKSQILGCALGREGSTDK